MIMKEEIWLSFQIIGRWRLLTVPLNDGQIKKAHYPFKWLADEETHYPFKWLADEESSLSL